MKRAILNLALSATVLTGMVWTVIVFGLVLFAGGWQITSIRSGVVIIGGLATMFAAPICVVAGGTLAYLKKAPITSIATCTVGSLCLSVVVGYAIYDQFHSNSAEMPSGFWYLAMLLVAALICDTTAITLWLEWKRNHSSSST